MKSVGVFLTENSKQVLNSGIIHNGQTAEQFIFSQIKGFAKNAQMVWNEEVLMVNEYRKDAQPAVVSLNLDEIDLEDCILKSDKAWRPKGRKLVLHETHVGLKTWDLLTKYVQLYCYRIRHYNDSLPKDVPKMPFPTCHEQLFHEMLIQPVMDRIGQNIEAELDKEYNDLHKTKGFKQKPVNQK